MKGRAIMPLVEHLYGVIGYPLGHSLSPLLHSTAFQLLDIPAALLPWPVEPKNLPAFMEAFRLLNIQGCCVTIPHKEAIMPLLDEVSERAQAVGAVNVIYRKGSLICGDNTDVEGFMAPLRDRLAPRDAIRALVLGAGGAGRAVLAGLRELGVTEITVAYNSKKYPEELAEKFALKQVPWPERLEIPADLVINVTPLGMRGKYAELSPWPADMFVGRQGLAYDIVYTPFETKFLREAVRANWQTIGGLPMFLAQAEAQFLTWTGRKLPAEAREKVREALAAG